ncbi:MAG: hypothetical protein Kow006_25770 [Gammaproteobacteria bacterium]
MVLMQLCTLAYLASSFGLLMFEEGSLGQTLIKVAIDVLFFGGIVWGALVWRGYTARWMQTWTALTGSSTLLALIALPTIRWLYLGAEAGTVDPLALLLWFGMLLWNLAVIGHVLRHALQVPLGLGVAIAVGYLLASVTTIEILFPRSG